MSTPEHDSHVTFVWLRFDGSRLGESSPDGHTSPFTVLVRPKCRICTVFGAVSVIPLFHDFTDETVLVFGGGPVGARKARRFAREATVVVVSPTFANENFGGAACVRDSPDSTRVRDWMDGSTPALVVAATDDDGLNDSIARAAHERGVLVNRADERGGRDGMSVVVPATVRDGSVTLAVSTDGTSPALSKRLREQFEDEFAGVGDMADLTETLRHTLDRADIPPPDRRAALTAVVNSDRVWKALDSRESNPVHIATDVVSETIGDTS